MRKIFGKAAVSAAMAAAVISMTVLSGCGGSAAPAATTAAATTAAATTAAAAETTAAATTAAAAETTAAATTAAAEGASKYDLSTITKDTDIPGPDPANSKAMEGVEIKGRLKKIKDAGVITVATEPYFAPFEFIDSAKQGDDQYVGFDLEIAKYIAGAIGVDLKVVPLEFSAVLSSVPDGKYDIAISGLAYTPARAEAMELSKGYYFSGDSKGYSLMIQEKDKDTIKTPADLAGKTIVYQSGSLQEALSKQQIDEASCKEVKRTSSSNDAYMTVQEGKADACVVSVESADLYAAANPGLYVIKDFRFDFPEEFDGDRIGTQKGETELMTVINNCIDEIRADGTVDAWCAKYEDYAKSLGLN